MVHSHKLLVPCTTNECTNCQILDLTHFYCSIELEEDPEVKTVSYLFNKLNYNNKNNLMAGLIVGGCR